MLPPMYRFVPARAPRGAAAPARPTSEQFPPNLEPATDFVIGQVDTGFVLQAGAPHPWLAGHLRFGAEDVDPLDGVTALDTDGGLDVVLPGTDGLLDPADAHGTFVAGLMVQQAPRAVVLMGGVLDDFRGDDASVAEAITALAAAGTKVITLALSGGPDEQRRPELLEAAIGQLPADVVVVAAAGNLGTSREVWPAAFPRVIAVGAVDASVPVRAGTAPPRAEFSSYGKWVDAYATGVDVLGPYVSFTETDGDEFTGWARWSGTSFAAAKVAGKIAHVAITEAISAPDAAEKVLQGPPVEIAGMPPWTWKPYVTMD